MKKLIIYPLMLMISISLVLATSVSRDLPSEASPGGTFTLTYTITDAPAEGFGVLIEEDISGGCKFSDGTSHLATGWLSPQTTTSLTILASSSEGACTFSGNYQFADITGTLPEATMAGDTTVAITGEPIEEENGWLFPEAQLIKGVPNLALYIGVGMVLLLFLKKFFKK